MPNTQSKNREIHGVPPHPILTFKWNSPWTTGDPHVCLTGILGSVDSSVDWPYALGSTGPRSAEAGLYAPTRCEARCSAATEIDNHSQPQLTIATASAETCCQVSSQIVKAQTLKGEGLGSQNRGLP